MNTYHPLRAASKAFLAELTSDRANAYYHAALQSTLHQTLQDIAIAHRFIQQTMGLFIYLCGEAYESGQVFREQVHDGYCHDVQSCAPVDVESEVIEVQPVFPTPVVIALLPAQASYQRTPLITPCPVHNSRKTVPSKEGESTTLTPADQKTVARLMQVTRKTLRQACIDRHIKISSKDRKIDLSQKLVLSAKNLESVWLDQAKSKRP